MAESKLPDKSLSSIIQGLLQKDPKERLEVALSLPQHPFFRGVDWAGINARTAPSPASVLQMLSPSRSVETADTVLGEPIEFGFRGRTIGDAS